VVNSTTLRAIWGYNNLAQATVPIPVGSNNSFNPAPQDRGQPTSYLAGRQFSVFTVDYPVNTNLVWTLRHPSGTGGSSTAGGSAAGLPAC
jgi:hypothetical protein